MKRFFIVLRLIIGVALLAGCSQKNQATIPQVTNSSAPITSLPQVTATSQPSEPVPAAEAAGQAEQAAGTAFEEQSDSQGAVEVTVRPLFDGATGSTLEFAVTMNTHSVDLSFDLAQLAVLTTDTGITLQAFKWDGPSGGHHVSGTLSFPAQADGKPVLEGAKQIVLAIKGVDAPARTFSWNLQQ
jgi:hypothetical protein